MIGKSEGGSFAHFSAPRHLAVTPTPIRRVLLIGGCFFDGWINAIKRDAPQIKAEHRLLHQIAHEADDPEAADLRIVQVPPRDALNERLTMPLRHGDLAGHEALLDRAVTLISNRLQAIRQLPGDAPTFVVNYLPPPRNPQGRLLPRYDLRNQTFFYEELNRRLDGLVADLANTFVLDIAEIGAMIGRERFQDNAVCVNSHGGFIGDHDHRVDRGRLVAADRYTSRFPFDVNGAVDRFWQEAVASYRVIRGIDRVKMLCVDLDDTLWRGVMAEQEVIDPGAMEGWPIGLAEALSVLRERGIILAIVSKNDPARIEEIWPQLFFGRLELSDFAIRKIGWRPKAEMVAEAIAEANVLPDTVVFLDDNPVERAQVKQAHPEVRVVAAPHLDWRRILLCSPEMQVPMITAEASQRNAMVDAQVRRETDRMRMGTDDFLQALRVEVRLGQIDRESDPQFPRAFELINKTNQFNTSGARWTEQAARDFFADGGRWEVFTVADRYTQYGLVGVVAIRAGRIEQFVMSCRVFGLGAEHAVLAELAARAPLVAAIIETPKNGPCRPVFREAGWAFDGTDWTSAQATKPPPAHVTLTHSGRARRLWGLARLAKKR